MFGTASRLPQSFSMHCWLPWLLLIASNLCMLGKIAAQQPAASESSERVFFVANIVDLEFPQGGLTSQVGQDLRTMPRDMNWVWARVAIDHPDAEACFVPVWMNYTRDGRSLIACSLPEPEAVEGTLFIPNESGTRQLRFRIPADAWFDKSDAKYQTLLHCRANYYHFMARRRAPGTAWFRFQRDLAYGELDPRDSESVRKSGDDLFQILRYPNVPYGPESLDLKFARELDQQHEKRLEDIEPYSLPEIDWSNVAQVEADEYDTLAAWIPGDQYALFLDSFESLTQTVDYASQEIPELNLLNAKLPTRAATRRYQDQLGLQLTRLARLLGPQLIESVATTGSDPFLPEGADIAILLEPKPDKLPVLKGLIETQVGLESESRNGTESRMVIAGNECNCFQVADRSLQSYVCVIDGIVVLSNCQEQIERISGTRENQIPSLAMQPEYKVFRGNYPLDPTQTGLLIVSSSAMQRWMSPQYRISELRLWTAQAALHDLKAAQLHAELHGSSFDLSTAARPYESLLGKVRRENGALSSEHFGSCSLPPPYSERRVSQATKAEAQAYSKWKIGRSRTTNYEYSPFAVQFRAAEKSWQAECVFYPHRKKDVWEDLFYAFLLDAQIEIEQCDPHTESLLHFSIAYNRESPAAEFLRNFVVGMGDEFAAINFSTWFGNNISIYVDDDEYWNRKPVESTWPQEDMPVALRWELGEEADPEVLTALVLRLFSSRRKPSDVQRVRHLDTEYWRLENNQAWLVSDKGALYLLITDQQLLLTTNEALLQRAIEREDTGEPPLDSLLDIQRWPGRSMNLQLDGRFAEIFDYGAYEWRKTNLLAIPILNEWRRLAPHTEPTEIHLKKWGERLKYASQFRWNEELYTTESALLPEKLASSASTDAEELKRLPPRKVHPLAEVNAASLGIDFEQDSVHFRIRIRRN